MKVFRMITNGIIVYTIPVFFLTFLLNCAAPLKLDEDGLPKRREFTLNYPGTEYLIDYLKYGEFKHIGTEKYQYVVKDLKGLSLAAGEGVYPNNEFVRMDPLYYELKEKGKLEGDIWKKKSSLAAQFFAWNSAAVERGVQQFFAAQALLQSGNVMQAIKTFYSIIVHFPKTICYFEDGKNFWYVAEGARMELEKLFLKYPQLGLSLEDVSIDIKVAAGEDRKQDVISVNPGKLVGKWVGMKIDSGLPEHYYVRVGGDPEFLKEKLTIQDFGTEELFVDYEKYGTFTGADGSVPYKYEITDTQGLAKAVGEGIFPNTESVKKNPQFKRFMESGWFKERQWDNYYRRNHTVNFYNFAIINDDPGRQLFFKAEILKEAALAQNDIDLARHAVKAYYAVTIHFAGKEEYAPNRAYIWYLANAVYAKLSFLLEQFPNLNAQCPPSYVKIINNYNFSVEDDTVYMQLGKLTEKKPQKPTKLSKNNIVERRGKGKVRLVKYNNGHWQLLVNGKPFQVRAITYTPSKVGESPHINTLRNWQITDDNKNGKADSPYDSYVDKNKNNKRDEDEPIVGDFQLMKEMGINAIRFYHTPMPVSNKNCYDDENSPYQSEKEFDKKLLRDLHQNYGIRIILGDFFGAYTVSSCADWNTGTDYRDPVQRERMRESVRHIVLDHKDEDYVLMWLLGNENNMSNQYGGVNATKTLAAVYPESYAKFLNEIAEMIHELDPDHPVMVGNQGTGLIEFYNKYAPAVDIIGINSYRGKEGFGDLFYYVKKTFDRPVIITEFGSDIVDFYLDTVLFDEESQVIYHRGTWGDINDNRAGGPEQGNCLGGVIFEWLDEWWKSISGPRHVQDVAKDSPMAFQDGWCSEDFFGIVSQGDGTDSPYLRQLRKAYYFYQEMWTEQ